MWWVKAANASVEEANKIEKQIKAYEKELKGMQSEKRHLIDLVTRTKNIDLNDIDSQMGDLKEREQVLIEDIEELKDTLSNLVTEKEIKEASVLRKGRPTKEDHEDQMKHAWLGSMERLNQMTLKEKRELLEHMFPGKDAQGRKYGVYLRKDPKGWQYEIYGDYKGMRGYILNKSKKVDNPSSDPINGLDLQTIGFYHVQV